MKSDTPSGEEGFEELEVCGFHIYSDELEKWEIPEGIPTTEPKLQTSMRAEAAHEKARFLREGIGIDVPSHWFEPDSSGRVRPDFLACVHVAYTFASKLPVIRRIGDISNPTDRDLALHPLNAWMTGRVDKKSGYRNNLLSIPMNVEALWRSGGAVVNPDQLVNYQEMLEIVALFRDRFRRRVEAY